MIRFLAPGAGVLIVLFAALGFGASDAHAVETDTEFTYAGQGSDTKPIFATGLATIDGEFTVPGFDAGFGCVPLLPPLSDDCVIDIFPGQVAFKLKLELVTTAKVTSPNNFHIEGPTDVVEGDTVPITSSNVATDGSPTEFVLKAGPKLTIHYDYDPDESGFACADYGQTDTADNSCDDIVFEPGEVTLMGKNLVLPYGGTVPLEQDTDLFAIPVCQLIGDLIGIGALTDVCDISVNAEANATIDATAGPGVTSPGFHADRDLLAGASTLPDTSGPITWPSPDPVVDNVFITCGGNPGSTVSYRLQENSYDTRVTNVTAGFEVKLKFKGVLDFIDDVTLIDLGDIVPLTDDDIVVLGAADNFQLVLGKYVAEQQPPKIDSKNATPTIGVEGSPVNFVATAHDNCPGNLSYQWDFSDGGVAYGADVFHTFADNGTYSYQVTVRDLRGNIAVLDPPYVVINATPIPNAGPDAEAAWGTQILFNGSAVDPGAGDQATLHYEWDFGDGTPPFNGNGGGTTSHAYSLPGDYVATLTVCDKDGACASDSRAVHVRKRNTSTGYLGSHTWTYDTQIHLSASLVDEFGQAVNGRTLEFAIDAVAATTGSTNSLGIADRTYQVTQTAGSHTVSASFAGDSLYTSSTSSDNSVVVLKPTTVTYTGSLTGGPNKVITLSAVLKDSEGKALAGRTINFVLGSQSASAVTDANGLAQTTLKLSQKNGSYNLTTTYSTTGPNAGDVNKYAGSGDLDTFKLQSK